MADHAPDDAGEAQRGKGLTAEEEAALEAGRLLFAGECRFFFAAQQLDKLPPPTGPEIAFAGRSNVGKSSLVNALTGQRSLARASNTPGRTKQLNFFDLAGRLTLVDMPGYGYAKAERRVKEDWQGLMFEYLRGRPTLRRVILLLDARIELKESDTQAMDLLDRAAVTYQLVLTKADAVKPAALERKLAEIQALARRHPRRLPHGHRHQQRDRPRHRGTAGGAGNPGRGQSGLPAHRPVARRQAPVSPPPPPAASIPPALTARRARRKTPPTARKRTPE